MIRPHATALAALALMALSGRAGAAQPPTGPASLTLEQAFQRLDAQNLTLAQSRQRAAEAKESIRQAQSALMPTAGANASYVRNSDEARLDLSQIFTALEAGLSKMSPVPIVFDRSGLPEATVIQPLDAFQAGASVRVPLFAGNAYWDVAAARHAAGAAERSVDAARLQLRFALSQAAWGAAAAEEMVQASERAIALAKDHVESARRAARAGTGVQLAVLQAETEVVRRESDLAKARSERDRARLAMGVLLGEASPVNVEVRPPSLPEALDVEALVSEALGARPELGAQQEAIEAAESQVESARWRVAPSLSASFSAFASTAAFPTGEKAGWKASADLSWVLYDGGFRYARRRQAEASAAGARAALDAHRLEAVQQVRDAVREVEVARERLRLAERQQQLASEAAATARRSFEAGLVGATEVRDANDRIFLADLARADANARLGLAAAALDRATGRGL